MARTPNPLGALMTGAGSGQLTPYQSSSVPAAAFGVGGEMLQQFGQDIARVGAVFEEQQRLADESAARDAVTAYREAMIGQWGEYSKLSGRAAVEGYGGFVGNIQGLRESTLASLPNDRARQMARAGIDGAYLDMYGSATTFSSAQDRAWSLESSKAAASNSISMATLARNDPFKVHGYIDAGVQDVVAASELSGDPPELVEQKVREYRGEAYKTVIANLMVEDPMTANALFLSVRDTLDPVSQARIAEELHPKVVRYKAETIVAAATNATAVPSAEAAQAFDYFVANGWTTAQAAAIAGNLQQESGFNPAAVGDNGTAFGIAQWRGERLEGLKTFAEAKGLDYKTFEAQLAYINYELQTNEAAAGSALRGATTLEEANDAMLGYERPAGWTAADPTGAHARDQRLANAYGFMGPLPDEGGNVEPFDPEKVRARILQMTSDPEVAAAALAQFNQQLALQDIKLAQDRQAMSVVLQDTTDALLRGGDVTIPETRIRALYPVDEAERIIGDLTVASIGGRMTQSIRFATPEQVVAMREDLASGTGLMSGLVRESFGIDAATPDGATADVAKRGALLDVFDKAVAARAQAIKDDVALFGLQDPGVSSAFQALQQSQTPEAWIAYATAQNALQEKLGVPEGQRRILSDQMKSNLSASITQDNPKGAADFFVNLQSLTGDMWPQVFGELTTGSNPIPQEYLALGLITDPKFRTVYTNALIAEKDKPGMLRKALGDTAGDFDDKVMDALQPFLGTFGATQDGLQKAAVLAESAKLLAYSLRNTVGPADAVAGAVSAITGQFDVSAEAGVYNARSPRGLGDRMELASTALRFELAPDDLQLLPNRSWDGRLYTTEEQARITVENARGGVWVTSPSDDGWVLLGKDGDVVRLKDGSPVLLRWEDATDERAIEGMKRDMVKPPQGAQ